MKIIQKSQADLICTLQQAKLNITSSFSSLPSIRMPAFPSKILLFLKLSCKQRRKEMSTQQESGTYPGISEDGTLKTATTQPYSLQIMAVTSLTECWMPTDSKDLWQQCILSLNSASILTPFFFFQVTNSEANDNSSWLPTSIYHLALR